MMRFVFLTVFTCAAAISQSVQTDVQQLGTSNSWVATFRWTAAANGTVPVTPVANMTCCRGFVPTQVEVVPGAVVAPTNGYSIALVDSAGADLFGGQIASLSSTSPQFFGATGITPPIQGTVSLALSGNSVAYATGVVFVFLQNPEKVNLFTTGPYVPAPTVPFQVTQPIAYGDFLPATAGNFTLNSTRVGGCANGYTNDAQIGTLQEIGGIALCSIADTAPYLFSAAGTFTSTTFVPTNNLSTVTVTYPYVSPQTAQTITNSGTAIAQTLLKAGMWLLTNDTIPYYGRITNVGTGGAITVSGWYQVGASTGGTPSGTAIYVNPLNHMWAQLPELYMNPLGTYSNGSFVYPTGTVTSGSNVITGVSSTVGVHPGQMISATGLPTNTAVTAFTSNTITVSRNATSTPGSPVSLTISAFDHNHGVLAELDLNNLGPAYTTTSPSALTGGSITSGNNTVTGLSSIPASVHAGMYLYGSSGCIPAGTSILSVASTTSLILTQQATATCSGSVSVTVFDNPFEGGMGLDGAGVGNNSNSMYNQRGSVAYGFQSMGASDSSFLARPNGFSAIPTYGFRVDGAIAGLPANPFAVTYPGNSGPLWGIDNQTRTILAAYAAEPTTPTAGRIQYNDNITGLWSSKDNLGKVEIFGNSPIPFASLPSCASKYEGSQNPVTDSTTNTWGATITGSGSNHVLAYCNGTNWTVMAK